MDSFSHGITTLSVQQLYTCGHIVQTSRAALQCVLLTGSSMPGHNSIARFFRLRNPQCVRKLCGNMWDNRFKGKDNKCIFLDAIVINGIRARERASYMCVCKRDLCVRVEMEELDRNVSLNGRFCPERAKYYPSEPTRVMCPWKLRSKRNISW